MTEMDTQNAQEQLAFIKSIMEDSQKALADNGHGFIVWGFLILSAGLGSYLLMLSGLEPYTGWMYLSMVALGWLYMITWDRKHLRQTIGKPFVKKILNAIWFSVLGTMTLLGFMGGASGTIDLPRMTSVMYSVLGIAYFLQGIVTGKTWVRNLGFGWWLGAIPLYFLVEVPAAILAASMMIGLQIIPGFIFKRQWKAQMVQD